MSRKEKTTGNKLKKRRFYKRKRFWLGGLLMCLLGLLVAWIAVERYTREYRERAYTYDLARINDLEKPSIILGRDGGELGRVFVQNRSVVTIEEVPEVFIDALRAGEDKRYYDHDGVDLIGITRAGLDWISEGEAVSGASTITQQLARGAFPLKADQKKREETGIERKMVEAFLAMRIEKKYSKAQILEFYLNRIYFGSGFYGVRSASLGYFGKEPADLSALESATIVGLVKNPTGLSPLNNPDASRVARNMVISRMAKLEMITQADGARMRSTPIALDPDPLKRGTSHLYERIADQIRLLVGDEALTEGGFTIHTTIDSRVQRAVERSLEASLRKAEGHGGYSHPKQSDFRKTDDTITPEYLQGAVLMVDHRSGEVIAHVGGRNYEQAPFDMIELGQRPLGTAFHPFLYAAAFEEGLTPASIVLDEAMDNRAVMIGGREGILGEWGMETPTPRYEKDIPLRRALETSKVAAAVRVANEAGLGKVVERTKAFGLPMEDVELLPRLAVGWESASLKEAVRGISAFARGGETSPSALWYVESIKDERGLTVFERPRPDPIRLRPVGDATAFQVHSILQGSLARGSAAGASALLEERPFNGAGKTGTTHDFSDNWFLGYNGRVSCGVWIGFLQDGKTIYEGAFSRDLAMPVWVETMNAAAKANFGGKGIPQPVSITEVEVCRVSGQRATPYCYETVEDPATGRPRSQRAAMVEFFRKGTENLPFCPVHSGSTGLDPSVGSLGLSELAVIDTTPVIPKAPALIGEDPYHSEQLVAGRSTVAKGRSGRTNVLDSFDLNDAEERVRLPAPRRLNISPE